MKLTVFLALILLFSKDLDRANFYSVLANGEIDAIDNMLNSFKSLAFAGKDAFEGTLLMRKAGLMTVPARKLKLFKEGRIKLQTAIVNDSTNAEFRFLRLIIQEQAPKIVNYRGQLSVDKQYVIHSFPALPPEVKQAVSNYSKSSAVIKPEDL